MARKETGIGFVGEVGNIPLAPDGKITPQQITRMLGAVQELVTAFNGRISLGDGASRTRSGNLDGQFIDYFFTLANTAYPIPHDLDRPVVWFVAMVDKNGAVISAANVGSWNNQVFYAKSDIVATTARILIV